MPPGRPCSRCTLWYRCKIPLLAPWLPSPLCHPHLAEVADKHLGFMDTDVRIAHQGREIVHHITDRNALVAPVPGHAHVVELLAIDDVWTHALGDQRLGLDGT